MFLRQFSYLYKKGNKVHLSLQSTWRYFDKLCNSNTAFSKVSLLCTVMAYLNKLIFNFFFGFTNLITRHVIPAFTDLWKLSPAHEHTAGDSLTRQQPQAQD